jgi:anti-anti-sigma regulatory factor
MSEATTDLAAGVTIPPAELVGEVLLPQLVQHLRQNRTALREEWARRITEAELLTAMSPEEIFSEATTVYDSYVEVLETGSVEALQDYARDLSERIIPRGVETDEVVGTELLLRAIRANRAKVVVIDITGVPTIDSTVANHLVQTVDASGLMGASVIITGLSSDIALTLVTIGLDLSKMNAVGDLQGGIEEAERLLGYEVTRTGEQNG